MVEIEVMRAVYRGQPCRICGRAMDAHSPEDDLICGLAEQQEMANSCCHICGRTVSQHSYEELHTCAVKDRDHRGLGPAKEKG